MFNFFDYFTVFINALDAVNISIFGGITDNLFFLRHFSFSFIGEHPFLHNQPGSSPTWDTRSFSEGTTCLGLREITIKPLRSLIKTSPRKEQEGEEMLLLLLLLDKI